MIFEDSPSIPPDIAENTEIILLPERSRGQYEKQYMVFEKWCKENEMEDISENTLLAYFEMRREKCKPSSLWTIYSMLRSCLHIHKDVDISKYQKLQALLKQSSQGYLPKKSKILEEEDIHKFIREANDKEYLAVKVILIIGYSGACRRRELVNVSVDDIEYRSDSIIISVPKTSNNVSRMFAITDRKWVELVKKYSSLRPKTATHKRFFVTYRNGYCVNTPIGINTMGIIPKEIATFLGLPDPQLFSSHCFRRSSAKHASKSGSDILTIKRLSGWKSTIVAREYVDCTLKSKIELPKMCTLERDVNLQGCSSTVSKVALLECDSNLSKNTITVAATGSLAAEENCDENLNADDSLSADPNNHLRESVTEGSSMSGNRITNFLYIFSQLKTISSHGNKLGCTFQNLVIEKEVRRGLFIKLFLKCERCRETFEIENVDNNSLNTPDINDAALKGIQSIGRGLDDLEKFLGNLDIPYKSQNRTYGKQHNVNAVEVVKVMRAKMSRILSNEDNCTSTSRKRPKMDEDTNTNLCSELKVKQESPEEDCNNEAIIKEEEICIKDEILEEELQPSPSFSSKNEITTDITIKKEVSEPSFDRVFQFRITLERNCWRQIQVPVNYTFRDLHLAIQKSMGWTSILFDYHLHKFELTNPATGLEDSVLMPDDLPFYKGLMDGEVKNEVTTKISQYFKSAGDRARYEYDFGRIGWVHEVLLENILARKEGERYPKCVGWKGACPPEDGVPYYSDEEKEDFDPLRCFES